MKLESEGGKVKPPSYPHDYTPEQLAELRKCKNDPVYFIKNYVKIQTKGGASLFELFDYQERMIKNYLTYDQVITMTSRQVGKTVTTIAFLLWWCCFKREQFVLVAANKGKSASEVMRKFKYMYEELPWWIKPGVKYYSITKVEFDNSNIISAETTTPDTGRGFTVNLLYLDEFAFVPKNVQDEFYTAILPTLSNGGRCIITSTPNSDEDKFAEIWFNAEETEDSYVWKDRIVEEAGRTPVENSEFYETEYEDPEMELREASGYSSEDGEKNTETGFKRFFVHWREHPDRDDAFRTKMLKSGLGMDKWLREYECQYVSEDPTLIESTKLMMLNYTHRKPRFVDRFGVRWYNYIEANTAYGVVLDPAEGVGGDNAVIQVWSLPYMKQVAEWASNTADQIEQTRMLFRVLKRIYDEQGDDPAHTGESVIYYSVECNGAGMGILNNIEVEGEDRFPGLLVDSEGNKVRGLRTTESSKRSYALHLKKLIERNIFVPLSKPLVSELKSFVKVGKGYMGKGKAKDDRVMSCILMCHLIDEVKYYEDGIEEMMHINLIRDDADEDEDGYVDDDAFLPMVF